MKLLDKIKNALFDEGEVEEEIAKKIDVVKTTEPKRANRNYDEDIKPQIEIEPEIKAPIMFEDDDFVIEPPKVEEVKVKKPQEQPKPKLYGMKPDAKKQTKAISLYGGYEEKVKEKFTPSPIISPVYGVLEKNYQVEELPKPKQEEVKPTPIIVHHEEKKPTIDLDAIREKAFGYTTEISLEDDKPLMYDLEEEDKPSIEKVTLGDAEEYFNDLGLEYNIDYKDSEKEKMTRISKNKELTDIVDEEIKEEEKITAEIKKKTPRKTKIVEAPIEEDDEIKPEVEDDEIEEKNLYDLIDMMYDSKE